MVRRCWWSADGGTACRPPPVYHSSHVPSSSQLAPMTPRASFLGTHLSGTAARRPWNWAERWTRRATPRPRRRLRWTIRRAAPPRPFLRLGVRRRSRRRPRASPSPKRWLGRRSRSRDRSRSAPRRRIGRRPCPTPTAWATSTSAASSRCAPPISRQAAVSLKLLTALPPAAGAHLRAVDGAVDRLAGHRRERLLRRRLVGGVGGADRAKLVGELGGAGEPRPRRRGQSPVGGAEPVGGVVAARRAGRCFSPLKLASLVPKEMY